MSNKSHYLPILIPLGLLVAIGWLLFSFYGNISYIDREGVFLIGLKGTKTLTLPSNNNIEIKQEIYSSQNSLARVVFPIKTNNPLILSLSLQDPSTEKIIRQITTPTSITGSQKIVWEFNPIENSKGKLYHFFLKTETGDNNLSFYTVPPERYDGGTLYINGVEKNEARIVLDWQYYTNHPFSTMIKRLAYAKPGIFNHPVTFIILLIVLGILTILIVWFSIKIIFKNTNDQPTEKKP